MFSTPILYHTARKHVNGRIAKLSHQILCIFELIKTFIGLFSGKTLEKKRGCKKKFPRKKAAILPKSKTAVFFCGIIKVS